MYRVVNTTPTSETRPAESGFALMAGILCAVIILLIEKMAAKDPISIEAKWGSVGGTNAGYDISQALALLAVFGGCLIALLVISYQGRNAQSNDAALHHVQDHKLTVESGAKKDDKR